mmetsp:Transcript_14912/g.32023  ORF Transcript_14912/g.32023 Transcript_14912/m.32023 type:complete len:382 (+) Transcript_14912:530-1675(+)
MRMRSGFMPRFWAMKSSISSRIAFCSSVISSVPILSLRTSCSRMREAKRVADLLSDPTTAATEGAWLPGAGWVTSAPKIMYGRSVIQPSADRGFCSKVWSALLITLLTPPSLALTLRQTLWQYWSRRLGKKPMPAFLATTHCEGTPRVTSLTYFASLYSGLGLVGITTMISWHGKLFSPEAACPHREAASNMTVSRGWLVWYTTAEGTLQNMPHPLAVLTKYEMNSASDASGPSLGFSAWFLGMQQTTPQLTSCAGAWNLTSSRFHVPSCALMDALPPYWMCGGGSTRASTCIIWGSTRTPKARRVSSASNLLLAMCAWMRSRRMLGSTAASFSTSAVCAASRLFTRCPARMLHTSGGMARGLLRSPPTSMQGRKGNLRGR